MYMYKELFSKMRELFTNVKQEHIWVFLSATGLDRLI